MIYHFKIWDDRTEALGKVFQGKPGVTAASVIEEIASLGRIRFLEFSSGEEVELDGLEHTRIYVTTVFRYGTLSNSLCERYLKCKKVIMPPNFVFTGTVDNIKWFCKSFRKGFGLKLPRQLFKKDEVKSDA